MVEGKLDAPERRFPRCIRGYKWVDKVRNTELYAEVRETMHRIWNNAEVSKLSDVVRKERVKLLGHITHQSDERLMKVALLQEPIPTWTCPRRRSSRIWQDLIKACFMSVGFDIIVQQATKIFGRGFANTWRSKNCLLVVDILADDRDLWEEICGHHGWGARESEAGSNAPWINK